MILNFSWPRSVNVYLRNCTYLYIHVLSIYCEYSWRTYILLLLLLLIIIKLHLLSAKYTQASKRFTELVSFNMISIVHQYSWRIKLYVRIFNEGLSCILKHCLLIEYACGTKQLTESQKLAITQSKRAILLLVFSATCSVRWCDWTLGPHYRIEKMCYFKLRWPHSVSLCDT